MERQRREKKPPRAGDLAGKLLPLERGFQHPGRKAGQLVLAGQLLQAYQPVNAALQLPQKGRAGFRVAQAGDGDAPLGVPLPLKPSFTLGCRSSSGIGVK